MAHQKLKYSHKY